MNEHKQQFIQFAIQQNALQFGKFTLKSGRVSPYFYNARLFNTGTALSLIGKIYAQTIVDANLQYDMLFGPAYAGIPLTCATAIRLAQSGHNTPFCFNRKEPKDHGEGGTLVGAPLQGKVLIIDDVITAGTAFRESLSLLEQCHAEPAGLVVQFDRQERGQTQYSVIQEIKQQYKIPVLSMITLQDMITFLSLDAANQPHIKAIEQYCQQYGAEPGLI